MINLAIATQKRTESGSFFNYRGRMCFYTSDFVKLLNYNIPNFLDSQGKTQIILI